MDPIMEPGTPGRFPSIQPISVSIAQLKTPPPHRHVPPVQSTWDWNWILGEIGRDRPHRHPTRLATSTVHQC